MIIDFPVDESISDYIFTTGIQYGQHPYNYKLYL